MMFVVLHKCFLVFSISIGWPHQFLAITLPYIYFGMSQNSLNNFD